MVEKVPVESRGGKLYVLAQAKGPQAVRLMIDSGSSYPVFYDDALEAFMIFNPERAVSPQ